MTLGIMENVDDKAPVRKKEEKQAHKEAQRKFLGPKTGTHGEHHLIDKAGGGWQRTARSKYSTSYQGSKRLIRTPCRANKKTSRAKWKTSFHRRKAIQKAERKIIR
eukprot:10112265-Heterocapsa_arctica.AAC.1